MPGLRLLKPTLLAGVGQSGSRRARSAESTRVLPRSEVDPSCKYPL
jgi:hypothetical protein